MRLSLALLSLTIASTSVLATPPPDLIDALEAAKQQSNKRAVMHAMHESGKRNHQKVKKWVVLPSSVLPSKLRAQPEESVFNPEGSEETASPTNRIRKVLQKRDASPAPPAPPPSSTISAAPAPSASADANSTVSTSTSVNPFDPFTWPQGVTNQYNATKDQFNSLSSLSKVGLAAIITVASIFLLSIIFCMCKISRARTRRRKEKLRLKAEAAQAQLSRSTTSSSSRSNISDSPSSIISMEKKRGDSVFGWMKKQARTGDAGEAMPEHDRLREMQQSSLTWDPKRAKSWDARARGLGQASPRTNIPEPPQAPGGSMKTRTRSWGGPK
ncbi:hypothetical protein JCM5350_003151 [Sporobolomyces pararoseus]